MMPSMLTTILAFAAQTGQPPQAPCQTHAWEPQVRHAIKFTERLQGRLTRSYASASEVEEVPMAYHGGVDQRTDGVIDAVDIERFETWVASALPPGYSDLACLDYEQPWWKELNDRDLEADRLADILVPYVQGLREARRLRPDAQWGYWGLPCLRHTGDVWTDRGLSIEVVLAESSVVYPSIYDCNRELDDTARTELHVSRVLAMVAGRAPVHVFVSPRYCGEDGDWSHFVPDEDFLSQVDAAMRATWTDAAGRTHRIAGVILWDSYGFTEGDQWHHLDERHVHYLSLLRDLAVSHRRAAEVNRADDSSPAPGVGEET